MAESISAAVSTAIGNAFRKKGQKRRTVYRKRRGKGVVRSGLADKMRDIQAKVNRLNK